MPLPSYPWTPTPLQSQLVSLHSWWEQGGCAREDTQGTFLGERAWQKSTQSTGKTAQECFMKCSPNRLVGCWAGPDYREDVWLMDCSLSELAFARGLANRFHCHMYRDSLPDTHTIPGHISPPTHTLLPSCLPGFWQRESHIHTGRDAEAHMISQEQQSEEVRVALGIRHLFENLAGLVALYIFN